MKTSKRGLDLIRKYEGCELKAYLCPANVWTIGYGHTGPDVKKGMKITQTQANALLEQDIKVYERGVLKALGGKSVEQQQFDAMVSLAYNIGVASFTKSTVVKRFKAGDLTGAANAFKMWNKATVKGKLTVLNGLVARRAEESALFLSADTRLSLATRVVDDDDLTVVPEGSTVPDARSDKPLSRSREIFLGGGLGLGGITSIFDNFTTDDARELKTSVGEAAANPPTVLEKFHFAEIASVLVVIIGCFIIWKRFKDRRQGIR